MHGEGGLALLAVANAERATQRIVVAIAAAKYTAPEAGPKPRRPRRRV